MTSVMRPLSKTMEATVDNCLAFCQLISKPNQKFSLNLTIDKDNFIIDNKELVTSSWQKKKKKSPSQLRKEAKRREERDKKVAEEVTDIIKPTAKVIVKVSIIEADDNITLTEEAEEIFRFKCEQCDYDSISEKGQRQHIRMKHQQ